MIRMIGCIIKVKKVVEILITKEVGEINLSICKDNMEAISNIKVEAVKILIIKVKARIMEIRVNMEIR